MVDQSPKVIVVGVGNPNRGDDAIGLEVARRLSGRIPANVRVIEVTGDSLALIDVWDEPAVTYVVDAAFSGEPAGTVHRIENDDFCLPKDMVRCSSHAFGLVETLELARALGRAPRQLTIYAIEGQSFEAGRGLSSAVAAAAETVTQRLFDEIAGRSPHQPAVLTRCKL